MPTVKLVRNSERSQWLRCRQSHHWAYTERIKPKIEHPALRFGTLVHKALEVRYPIGVKRGPLPSKTFSKVYYEQIKELGEFGFKADDEWVDAHDLGVKMMKGYVELYGKDTDYEVLATERTFKVKVSGVVRPTYFVGTMDGVWKNRNNGRILIKDYKTTKDNPTLVSYLGLDEQATMYMSYGVADLVRAGFLKGYPSHMLYTFLKKAYPSDDRPVNAEGLYLNNDGSVSKRQGENVLFHRETVYRDKVQRHKFRQRAIAQLNEMNRAPVYKNPSKMNCGGCGYRDMCEMDETGADIELLKKLAYVAWDPYDAHELKDDANAR